MGDLIPITKARAAADKIVAALSQFCSHIEIAGSIRRGRPWVGDLDFVIEPKGPACLRMLLDHVASKSKIKKRGEQYVVSELLNGMQLDFWFAHAAITEERDMLGDVTRKAAPGNFGTLLVCRTGSKEHNIHLASTALRLGLNWQPHQGVMQAGRVIASETEADVFQALKLDYLAPERRER